MGNMRFLKIIFGVIAGSLIFVGFYINPIFALSASPNTAQGIEISPTLVELNATKLKTYNITLNVTNVTSSDLIYQTTVDDFNAAGETGSPHIILDSKLPTTASIKTWVSSIPQFTLQSHKSVTINAQITVPNNAEPGGHYGVLRFYGTAPELEGTGVGLSASAGVLILVRVDGQITEKADLASFYSSQDDKQSWLFNNSPITFVTRIKNEGNIHVKPIGNIEVRDWFGNLVSNLTVNKDSSNILPNSIRRFENTLKKDWMFGLYTVNLTTGYGTTGQAITSTIKFWVIPYTAILIGLMILVTVTFVLSRLIRVYNRHIIEKSKNENKTKHRTKKKD
jgi:hypothetical protein